LLLKESVKVAASKNISLEECEQIVRARIYPSKSQTAILENTLDLCRELYNAALQEKRDAWKLNRISINYYDQQNQLPAIKAIRMEFSGVYSQVLQDVLKRIDKAFKAFFDRVKKGEKAGFPRFKGQSRFDSFCYPLASIIV
jgi:putative transposase